MKRILFYVSGHGFGHAARSAEVIRALGEKHPDIGVLVTTNAPNRLFAGLPALVGEVTGSDIDTGVVEGDSSLSIDRHATVARLMEFMGNCDEMVAVEADRARREKISLIVADIPFLAGEIARQANVPCVAIGNFTWDWIYAPYSVDTPDWQAHLSRIGRAYGNMSCYLRLPFSHDTELFRRTVDVPLITRPIQASPPDVLRKLGIDAHDPRPRILHAIRSPASFAEVARAASNTPDRLFLYFGSYRESMPDNTRAVVLDGQMAFPDVLNACDAVVSKLGYGALADCLSTGTPLLFPPRSDFREDEILAPEAVRLLRAHKIPLEDFESGRWNPHLQQLEKIPEPTDSLATDGAAVCAKILAEM